MRINTVDTDISLSNFDDWYVYGPLLQPGFLRQTALCRRAITTIRAGIRTTTGKETDTGIPKTDLLAAELGTA